METAFIKYTDNKCGGEVAFKQVDDARWLCEIWHLAILFPQDSGKQFHIELEELGVRLSVQP